MQHKNASDFYMDGDIVRWKSNNAIPFADTLCEFVRAGLITEDQKRASILQRKVEDAKFIRDYIRRERDRKKTPEELAEMRAAFGLGSRVVNIFTGEITDL